MHICVLIQGCLVLAQTMHTVWHEQIGFMWHLQMERRTSSEATSSEVGGAGRGGGGGRARLEGRGVSEARRSRAASAVARAPSAGSWEGGPPDSGADSGPLPTSMGGSSFGTYTRSTDGGRSGGSSGVMRAREREAASGRASGTGGSGVAPGSGERGGNIRDRPVSGGSSDDGRTSGGFASGGSSSGGRRAGRSSGRSRSAQQRASGPQRGSRQQQQSEGGVLPIASPFGLSEHQARVRTCNVPPC